MKKVLMFVHGQEFPEFKENGLLHKNYQRKSGQRIFWQLISGYLNSHSDYFSFLLKKIENTDIFICDSDNTNLEGEIEKKNFDEICFKDLLDSLKKIKEHKPDLRIFIKNLPYVSRGHMKELSNYGTIIENWLDKKVISDLK